MSARQGQLLRNNNVVYVNSKGLLTTTTYGNGVTKTNTYDKLNRLSSVSVGGTERYTYEYDGKNRTSEVNDLANSRKTKYEYDILDRLVSVREIDTSSGQTVSTVKTKYDSQKNRVSGYDTSVAGITNQTDFVYGTGHGNANLITDVKVNGGKAVTYTYDSLNRLQSRKINDNSNLVTEYTYLSGTGTNGTTTLVASETTDNVTTSYTYDSLGNITSISENGVLKASYHYDALGQLVREDNVGGYTYTYDYDNGGNILCRKEYNYSAPDSGLSTEHTSFRANYTYGDNEWKDLLTDYDGWDIEYDSIGNPVLYTNDRVLSWQDGRKLASVDSSIYYSYNSDGYRTGKEIEEDYSISYALNGSKIISESHSNGKRLYFFYDESGNPIAFKYYESANDSTPDMYYYVRNIRGDIVRIVDTSGSTVVNYTYSTWGEVLSVSGSEKDTIGRINPFRYRGYYYDLETHFYYVNSRYYDPEIGRWINADNQIAGVGGEVLGYNMFAYCMNNPVNMSDPTGNWPKMSTFFAVVAVAALAVAMTVVTYGAAAPLLVSVGGGILGGISAATIATGAFIVAGVAATAAVVTKEVENTKSLKYYRDQSVYIMRDKNTEEVKYVGRTNDPVRRQREHDRDWKKENLQPLEVKFTGLTKIEARLMEQILISSYTLENLYNARREIAVGKVIGFAGKIGNIISIFGGSVENEFLNLMER